MYKLAIALSALFAVAHSGVVTAPVAAAPVAAVAVAPVPTAVSATQRIDANLPVAVGLRTVGYATAAPAFIAAPWAYNYAAPWAYNYAPFALAGAPFGLAAPIAIASAVSATQRIDANVPVGLSVAPVAAKVVA